MANMSQDASIILEFPDGAKREYPKGITALDIAKGISNSLARQVLGAVVNGSQVELDRPIHEDGSFTLVKWEDDDGKEMFWHSSAHLLAEALQELYGDVKFGIGPPIDNGFYYDVDFGDRKVSEDELPKIEAKMRELAKKKSTFKWYLIPKDEAIAYFNEKADPYKIELLEGLQDGQISFVEHGNFVDLCRGGHIPNTGLIKAIKLLNVAGAYWRGDEKNKMLTRIYGVSFPKQTMLEAHLQMLEEAKKRDHRKLGKTLGLFTFSQKVGQGLPLWLPKGAELRERLEHFMRDAQKKAGYSPVITPHIGHKDLYVTSGHYEKYGEDSFQPISTPHEGETFLLKPMNCPHHCEIYKSEPRSYRDLPLRLAEFGTVYRYEQSGELHGLTRVRGFTQDDAHIFCMPDQVKDEFKKVIDLVLYVFKSLGFEDYTAQISLRHKTDRSKYIGSEENWTKAEAAIMDAAKEKGLSAVVEYDEAAFYGPKLDFMVKDALQRQWQLGTIQVDYNLPDRFELEYIGNDNEKHRPVMIHRAPFGSMERFVAVLTEHCAGDYPLWLTPTQVTILPISDKFMDYAQKVWQQLRKHDIRVSIDERSEKIGKKIRDAELMKTPYMLVIGEKEVESEQVAVRKHKHGDQGSMDVDVFIENIIQEKTV